MVRTEVRLAWWLKDATTWRKLVRSVPKNARLPEGDLPAHATMARYHDRKPVFFGHYWMEGAPVVEADYALCLDYSAGKPDGKLVAYEFDPAHPRMDVARLTTV